MSFANYLQEGDSLVLHSESFVLTVQVYDFVINKQAHIGDSLAAAQVFSVSSLCNELPCGLVSEIYRGKRQRPSLLQNLGSDEYILSHLGSIHISVRQ